MTTNLQKMLDTLQMTLPQGDFQLICKYLFTNPGKLFRSNMIYNTSKDLYTYVSNRSSYQENIDLISSFIEIHHTYTLIHDDLPSMDNDDTRRGQSSTHIKFGEANAILAGDALIVSSFQCLSKLKTPYINEILKLTTWATGAKGLIHGQFLDLQKQQKTFEQILRIHELKTSRLFQICTISPLLLTGHKDIKYKTIKDYMRIGAYIGLIFQLLDDYFDKDEQNAKLNNLFALDPQRSRKTLKFYQNSLQELLSRYKLENVKKQISDYTKSVDVQI